MALPALSPEQRQAALQKARQARAARSDLLAGLKAGTLTLADVLGRGDDLARKTKVALGAVAALCCCTLGSVGRVLCRHVADQSKHANSRSDLLAEISAVLNGS